MTEIQIHEENKKKNTLILLLKKTDHVFANSLRRAIVDYVPTMAIEDVEFKQNNSILYDEIIAHRLGLIPLKTDLESYELSKSCKCEGVGCARCQLKLTLSVKGPAIVKAGDMKSQDPKVKPVYPEMPIVKLLKGQEIEFTATATLGIGKEHAKWSPGNSYYKYKPVIDIDKKIEVDIEPTKICPVDVFEKSGKSIAIKKDNLFNCHLCGQCVDVCPQGAIKLNENDSEIIFYVESWGQLSPKEIIVNALEKMEGSLEELHEELKKI